MPRCPRIKPAHRSVFYHIYNRAAGDPDEMPFGEREKEKFIAILRERARFYVITLVAYQILGNHFHLVVLVPAEPPCPKVAAARYNAFYAGTRPTLRPEDPLCRQVAMQMRDVSEFSGRLEQTFSSWFNRTRPGRRRRGGVWAGRFGSSILGEGQALWNCMLYVELNPVRAGLSGHPGSYRFGSWGEYTETGSHPCTEALEDQLAAWGVEPTDAPMDRLLKRFAADLDRILRDERSRGRVDFREGPSFVLSYTTPVRYWNEGLIIGTKEFIREIVAEIPEENRRALEALPRARDPCSEYELDMYAYHRLRHVPW